MRVQLHVGTLVIALFCSGCATMLHGTTQKVELSSNPVGAAARIDPGDLVVTTPASVELRRKHDYRVSFEMQNYQTKKAYIERETAPATYWNLIAGGIIGLMVDFSDGAGYQLVPDHVNVVLEPLPSSAVPAVSSAPR